MWPRAKPELAWSHAAIRARSSAVAGRIRMPAGGSTARRGPASARHRESGYTSRKSQRQIDRPPELRRIEARRDALRLDLGEAALQEARAQTPTARRVRDQHHADPRDRRPQRQHQRTGDPNARSVADAEGSPLREHQPPVGRHLVPAGLDRQVRDAFGMARLENLDLQLGRSARAPTHKLTPSPEGKVASREGLPPFDPLEGTPLELPAFL